ncbi:BsaA family SipW-dependent biofilm matrix protein [Candidatus Saccharibacteria bacterium]|nr:BsaA family SipW-dependent biofilm matrix protein [Candidatus Saccharibacteria bacterium]
MAIKLKNKKNLLTIAIALAVVGVIGAVFALGSDKSIFGNQFEINNYKVAHIEEFTSPSDWKTCDETAKTFVVKNEGNAPIAVRIKYEEYWRNAADTDYLPSVKDGVTLAIINFQNETDWTLRSDGYYYYKETLAPGASTSSLFKSVTLNCDANLGADNVCSVVSGNLVCTKPNDEYEGATYHLEITAETMQGDVEYGMGTLHYAIASRANNLGDYQIDFSRKATISNDVAVANGNGINKYTENGVDIYYYRGQISDNNVIWSGLCWKIMRTTAAGGIKMIYNGAPSNGQCNATGINAAINNTTYAYNTTWASPAHVGYKYGTVINLASMSPGTGTYTFANEVSRDGNTYTLSEDAISGTWANKRVESAARYHYFCTNGATSCSNTQIAYITNYNYGGTIYYLPLNGYDDIEAAKAAMFTNTTDSNAKRVVESWFESKHLDDNKLEDAVFCNDRSYYSGAIKSKDSVGNGATGFYGFYNVYGRNVYGDENGVIKPSLECTNSRDAFQVSNTNAELNHKIGLPTADEMTLAGVPWFERQSDTQNYLYTGRYAWLASPSYVGEDYTDMMRWNESLHTYYAGDTEALRPMVVLKAGTVFTSGTGLKTDPYIVE